ncbi:Ig-like domain-containing protein, partial [Undibacterium sp. SXout7W]|uniref:Ig-like domain-containing protein n=1 Tax=Undibacterium sp. SXout7W TaxID=3413049 RepID=UPI003BF0D569
YTVDHTAPLTTVTGITLSSDTGVSATDFATTTARQTISGNLNTPLQVGETIRLSLDNGNTWITVAAPLGATTWSLDTTLLAGSNTLQVRVEDVAGNASTALVQ